MTSKGAREKIISSILRKIADENGIKDYVVVKEEIPCTGKNYTAAIYLIKLCVKERVVLDLFAKVVKANESERKAMQISEMYRRERFVYLELVKIYNDLQDKYGLMKEDRYNFVRFYAANAEPMEETVVLENLSSKGYHSPDRFEPMDWIFASKSVAQLAKFHALSFIFERENPKLFEAVIKSRGEFIYTKCRPPPDLYEKYTKDRVNAAMEGLSLENAERFKEFLLKNDPNRGHQDQHKLQSRPCFVHGDYKHTNLMTKYQVSTFQGKSSEILKIKRALFIDTQM